MPESEFVTDVLDLAQKQAIWARRAAVLAREVAQEDEGEQVELVLVQVGQGHYGLEAAYVFDIRPLTRITPVPRTPDWVAGVINLRGRIFSVVDLQRFLGLPHFAGEGEKNTRHPYLVVIETPEMELALRVDDVLTVGAVPVAYIQATDEVTVPNIRADYVRGVIEPSDVPIARETDMDLWVVLDLPALLADKRLVVREDI